MNNNYPLVTYDRSATSISPNGIDSPALSAGNPLSGNRENVGLNTFQAYETKERVGEGEGEALPDKITEAMKEAVNAKNSSSETNADKNVASDENLKLFGKWDGLLEAIEGINAYRFRYKEGADEVDPDATPDKEHIGVMAQELEKSPVTKSSVEKDPLSGFLTVNTKELTMAEMAILTEMASRIMDLEKAVHSLSSHQD